MRGRPSCAVRLRIAAHVAAATQRKCQQNQQRGDAWLYPDPRIDLTPQELRLLVQRFGCVLHPLAAWNTNRRRLPLWTNFALVTNPEACWHSAACDLGKAPAPACRATLTRMVRRDTPISFKARLQHPAEPENATWSFLVLPKAASTKLPTRSMVTVDGNLAGAPFQATLEPDGAGSHWLKVEQKLRKAAGVEPGDTVALEVAPVEKEPEPKVPHDLRKALRVNPAALATWKDITPVARRDWVHWVTSGKKAETRVKRIGVACDKLAGGDRRACCFDRSGQYSRGNMGPPKAR